MEISSASITHSIASFQSQILGSLFGSSSAEKGKDLFSALLAQKKAGIAKPESDAQSVLPTASRAIGPSATGRNMTLFDPESAYKMMSVINNREVLYQAQFAEMNEIKSGVSGLQAAAQSLNSIGITTPGSDIQKQLQNFTTQYNKWVERFNPDVQQGGLLAGTQAAEVSLYELEQSVKNRFNGARDGMHGLSDLGISIDPNTKFAKLDTSKLSAVLNSDKQAAVNTVQAFSANFGTSAGLLNSSKNFIPNQLDNLHRAIDYIKNNKQALRVEFGTGDPAKPSAQIARALAAYQQNFAV
jgi:hypothetical protein